MKGLPTMKRVCANCFGEEDLEEWISHVDGAAGCDF
jgi:hypothetical protein